MFNSVSGGTFKMAIAPPSPFCKKYVLFIREVLQIICATLLFQHIATILLISDFLIFKGYAIFLSKLISISV